MIASSDLLANISPSLLSRGIRLRTTVPGSANAMGSSAATYQSISRHGTPYSVCRSPFGLNREHHFESNETDFSAD